MKIEISGIPKDDKAQQAIMKAVDVILASMNSYKYLYEEAKGK